MAGRVIRADSGGEENPVMRMMKAAAGLLAVALTASAVVTAGGSGSGDPRFSSPLVKAPPAASGPSGLGLPLDFVENRGQWDKATEFVAHRGSLAAHFQRDAIELYLGEPQQDPLRLAFEGASAGARLVGEKERAGTYNFYMGDDPDSWRADVAAYGSLLYSGLYDGVDVRVREGGVGVEYDVLLAPFAGLEQVVIRADGASSVRLGADGALVLGTPAGPLRQAPPVTWEVLPGGETRPVESRFRILDAHRYGFAVPGHDPRLPLVVDPGLDWATFVGGSGDESVRGLELTSDGSGDVVIAGQTQSPDFQHTRGNLAPTGWTPYVARLNATGSAVVYATFFGGTANHSLQDVALDAANRPVLVGDTTSLDFPTTPGAYDRTPGDGFHGDYDAYVIKFAADGSGPVFGTYLGGAPATGTDQAWNAGHDVAGNVIVSGFTNSPGFPTTAGAYDRTIAGQDIFISRLDPTGSQLTYSTFLGGNGTEDAFDMAVDAQGFVTLTGKITQFAGELAPFPTTADAFDRTLDAGGGSTGVDGFVSRLKLDGGGNADLKYSTFLGGADWKEAGVGLALDPNDSTSVTVVGWTYSGDFPTTAGALLRTHFAPVDTSMGFVSRFRFPATGGSLVWSTLYGAPGNQTANDVVVDSTGAVILAGATAANNPPTTERSFDRVPGIGSKLGEPDGFVARLSGDGSRLLYSTLLGGGHGDDTAQHVVYAGGTSAIVAGLTDSPDFPVTPGAHDTIYAADGKPSLGSSPGSIADDVFVARVTLEAPAGGDATGPPAPELKAPSTGSTFTAHVLGLTLDWNDVADPSEIRAYHIQTSPNAAFRNDFDSQLRGWRESWMPTSIDVQDFSVSRTGTFYWRVQALDGANNLGPWSSVRSFTVESPTPPAAPTLVSPPNAGRFGPGTVIFDWNPAARGKFYEIQVDTSSSFSNANKTWVRALTATRWTGSFTAERTYFWRVRSSNDSFTDGPWSSVRSFEIKNGEPPAPVPPPDSDGGGGGSGGGSGGAATAVAGFTPQEPNVNAGGTSQLTVNLNGTAPAGGAVLALASNHPENASVPPSVTVPAGATSATFTVTAPAGQSLGGYQIISAEYGGVEQGVQVNVIRDDPTTELSSMTLAGNTSGTISVIGGATLQGTLGLIPGWIAGAGGAVVALGSTNPALASVSNFVTIPQGANSTTYTVTTQPVTQVTKVSVLAARSMTLRFVLELLPPGSLQELSLSPSTVTGGQSSTGTVTLASPAPAGGVSVALSSHDTRWATVPASVTVPEGSSSTTFTVTTNSNNSGEGQFSIIKALAGGITRQQTINVNPAPPGPQLSSLSLNPTGVTGGSSSTGTVTLSGTVSACCAIVSLSSSNTALATVPASVNVPVGSTSATFAVTTTTVTSSTPVTITASRGTQRSAILTVNPPGAVTLSSLALSPASVTGGSPSTGTVALSGAAPAGGVAVTLSSSNTAVATVPASVTVAAGASSATFTVGTTSVSSSTPVTISASAGGVTRTATLTVAPASTGTLSAPTLLSPANDARFLPGQAVTFDWADVAGAASYQIQIDDSSTIGSPFVLNQTGITVSRYTTSTLPTKRLWWRVRANDASGNPGSWSSVRRIEVKN